jgi:trk system potassium uptake protein TrkH
LQIENCKFPLGVVGAYLLLILIGVVVFRTEGTMVRGNEMSRDRAIFTVLNAVTLTGFQQTTSVSEYRWPGQLMVLVLIVGGSLFTMIACGVLVVRIAGLPYAPRHVVMSAVIFETIAVLVGTAFLHRPGASMFTAMFQAASAVGNAGHWLGAMPDVNNARLHFVLLPLAVLGGLGLPVIMELVHMLPARRRLSTHARTVLTTSAALYLAGLVVFTMFGESVISASATTLNARTPGLPLALPEMRSMQWLLIVLMMIGGSSAGTAGGIKTTTVATLMGGVRRALRGEVVGRAFGIAIVWLGIYLLIGFASLLLLLWTEPQLPADRLLFIVVSALSNVGLSHDPVSVVREGLHILGASGGCRDQPRPRRGMSRKSQSLSGVFISATALRVIAIHLATCVPGVIVPFAGTRKREHNSALTADQRWG